MPSKSTVDKKNYIVLGILIRSSRINQGYSLRDLAELTKISHTLISNIEKGKLIPTEDTLWRANVYKCADKSSHPHWLTWNRVDRVKPDFHRPEFFGTLVFKN